jgi:hypothetical protein
MPLALDPVLTLTHTFIPLISGKFDKPQSFHLAALINSCSIRRFSLMETDFPETGVSAVAGGGARRAVRLLSS